MTSDMGEMFNDIKRAVKAERAARRDAFDGTGWTRHHETHYSRDLLGDRLDYWPGTKRWRWRGRSYRGEVQEFIDSRKNATRLAAEAGRACREPR